MLVGMPGMPSKPWRFAATAAGLVVAAAVSPAGLFRSPSGDCQAVEIRKSHAFVG
jgi:hypothetical protein